MLDLIIAIVAAGIILHGLRAGVQLLWFRFAYRHTGMISRSLFGRYSEGTYLPLWAAFLRRFVEGGPR